jgi:hypothetical protein
VLIGLSAEGVTLALQQKDGTRKVAVLVGSGRNWYEATRFPHNVSDEGASTGDDKLDREIRQRAAEELIRLAAAKEALDGRGSEDLR